ncbi:MAG: oxidoreductase [Gammaproteobacteria bacterium]|nr:MAG: oxidoreductase [Gammaproteobacteria bacterium]
MSRDAVSDTFRALVLSQDDDGRTHAEVRKLSEADLPDGDVLLDVAWSSLNYKDGLAITGKGKVVRNFPMVPGIDLAGRVRHSESPDYRPGDPVILTGWGVGERYWGGYSQRQRVRSEWLVPLPQGLSLRDAMTIGTAGLTAMLCVMTLEEAGVTPDRGKVVVTGASGGVGSVAVTLLARLGYEVAAVTGRPEGAEWLRGLGASEIVSREEMASPPRPLESQRWAGAVDTVGGVILARVLAEMGYGGAVAACGLAGGHELHTTVMPFILRNVSLRGVDSVMCPRERRIEAWHRLARELPHERLSEIEQVARLEDLPRLAEEILAGRIRGRVVVDLETEQA